MYNLDFEIGEVVVYRAGSGREHFAVVIDIGSVNGKPVIFAHADCGLDIWLHPQDVSRKVKFARRR